MEPALEQIGNEADYLGKPGDFEEEIGEHARREPPLGKRDFLHELGEWARQELQ